MNCNENVRETVIKAAVLFWTQWGPADIGGEGRRPCLQCGMQITTTMETLSALPSSPDFLLCDDILKSESRSPSSGHLMLLHLKRRRQRSHTEGSNQFQGGFRRKYKHVLPIKIYI